MILPFLAQVAPVTSEALGGASTGNEELDAKLAFLMAAGAAIVAMAKKIVALSKELQVVILGVEAKGDTKAKAEIKRLAEAEGIEGRLAERVKKTTAYFDTDALKKKLEDERP